MFNSCKPRDCRLLRSFVHGILQARVLEWVAISFSRGSSQLRTQTQVSCIAGRFFTDWAMREAHLCINHPLHAANGLVSLYLGDPFLNPSYWFQAFWCNTLLSMFRTCFLPSKIKDFSILTQRLSNTMALSLAAWGAAAKLAWISFPFFIILGGEDSYCRS